MKAWLSGRNQRESQCLLKYFEQTVDSIADFVLHKSGYIAVELYSATEHSKQKATWTLNFKVLIFYPMNNLCDGPCTHDFCCLSLCRQSATYSEVGLMETCLAYLSTLLNVSWIMCMHVHTAGKDAVWGLLGGA